VRAKLATTHAGMRAAWGIITSTRHPVIHRVRSGLSVQLRVSGRVV